MWPMQGQGMVFGLSALNRIYNNKIILGESALNRVRICPNRVIIVVVKRGLPSAGS